MRIGIKLGSNIITSKTGKINEKIILEVCRQVAYLMKNNHEVFIVSSGAVASDAKKHRSKNLRAGVGQIKLTNYYQKFFQIFKIEVSQHLFTDREVIGKNNSIAKNTLLEAMREKVVPIINGNDVIDGKELKALEICADNDTLFKSVCLLLKADLAIVGFGKKGLVDDRNKIVREVSCQDIKKAISYAKKGSLLGHGDNGMKTKIKVMGEMAQKGIIAVLAPGKEADFILRAIRGDNNFGTRFVS
jgi:glutamate 5-kinase